MLELNKLYTGDCIEISKQIDDCSIDMILTSPPYDSVRSYSDKIDKQNYNGYSFDFENLSLELTRILKPGGIICWIVNDQYKNGSRTLSSFKQAIYFKDICNLRVHDVMIYQKSGFNFPANNRYHQVYEFIHVLSKGKPKTFNPIMDKKNAYPGQKSHGKHRGVNENDYVDMSKIVKAKPAGEYGKRYNVWYVKVGGGHVTKDKIAYKHPACVDEITECLTEQGWRNYTQLQIGDRVASYSLDNNKLSWQLITNIISFDYSGEAIYADGRHLDMVLTPNHRTIIKTNSVNPKIKIIEADKILKSHSIPCAAEWESDDPRNNILISELEAEMLGWFLSEGSFHFNKEKEPTSIEIYQSVSANIDHVNTIENMFKNLHIKYSKYIISKPFPYDKTRVSELASFYTSDKNILQILLFFMDKNKNLNSSILKLSYPLLKIFFKSFLLGDGHIRATGNSNAVTQYKNKDMLQAIGVRLNLDSYINNENKYIEFNNKKKFKLLRNAHQSIVRRIEYLGKMWCLEVENNNTFVARRNNHIFFTGNCMPESLAGDLITSFSNPVDLIFDPFVGSGTTAKMAKILNRNYIGCDLSQDYIDIANERIDGILI